MRYYFLFNFLLLAILTSSTRSFGQCPSPQLYDLDLTSYSDAPVWVNCIDNVSDPDDFDLLLVSPNDITNYQIDWGDGSGVESGSGWVAGNIVQHTYTALGTFIVTLSETDNGCTSTIIGTLINDRKPGATAIPPTTNTNGCAPHILTFENTTTNVSAFTTYEWDWGDGELEMVNNPGDPGSAGEFIDHTYERGSSGCGMEVTLTAQSLCATTFVTFGPYDMWDLDTALVSASSTQLCVGDNVTFSDVSDYNCVGGIRRIQWDFSDLGGPTTGWLAATPGNRTYNYFVDGPIGSTFTVTMADSNFCGVDYDQVTVEIIAPPTAAVVPDPDTACVGENINFDNQSTGGNLFHWNFNEGDGWYTVGSAATQGNSFSGNGDFTVQLVADISGSVLCRDTAEALIHIVESPQADFSVNIKEGCDSLESIFTNESSIDAVSWDWTYDNGLTDSGIGPHSVQYGELDVYLPSLRVENAFGCFDEKTDTLFVYPVPKIGLQTDSICFGQENVFLNTSALNSSARGTILREKYRNISGSDITDLTSAPNYPDKPSLVSYISLFEAPTNTGSNYGTRVRGFIYPPETGNYIFWIATDDDGELWLSSNEDPGNSILIANVNGFTNPRQWNKYSSQQSNPVFLESGRKYYIEALHKEGDGGDNLAVGWQLPSSTLERPIPGNRLSPWMEGQTITTWSWDFNDAVGVSSDAQPSYSYTQGGTFYPILEASTSKCSAVDSFPVFVGSEIRAGFQLSDTIGCTPMNLTIVDTAIGNSVSFWSFGEGTLDTVLVTENDTLNFLYFNNTSNNRNFNLSQIVQGELGCRDTFEVGVTVFPSPQAAFGLVSPTPPCAPFEISITNNSTVDDSNFVWRFGEGETSNTNEVQFNHLVENKSGQIRFDTISLTSLSSNGCTNTATKFLTVFPEPDYDLNISADTGCHPLEVNLSVIEPSIGVFWSFGDGYNASGSNVNHTFRNTSLNDTTYQVSGVVTSVFACRDTVDTTVFVKPSLNANFLASPSLQTFPFADVNVTNFSTGQISNYLWRFGDGDSSESATPPVHSYDTSGTYDIKLFIDNEICFDSANQIVTILPREPTASFVAGDSSCAPLPIEFKNTSTWATEYLWDFGDGNTSTEENPIHVYDLVGIYSVKLRASGLGGVDSVMALNIIQVMDFPNAGIQVLPDSQHYPSRMVNLINTSTGSIDYWEWRTDTGVSVTGVGPHQFVFDTVGDFSVELFVQNDYQNCVDSASETVSILYPFPIARFIGPDTGCAPLNVQFTDQSVYADSVLWLFGDGDSSRQMNPNHIYDAVGLYDVKLYAYNESGVDSIEYVNLIHVLDDPVSGFSSFPSEQFYPDTTVTFISSSTGFVESYHWVFGNGQEDSILNPAQISFDTVGDYLTTLTVRNHYLGCEASFTDTITILPPKPIVNFSGADTGCAPLSVRFTNESLYGTNYFWEFGDGDTSESYSPEHLYDSTGVFTVKLWVSNESGEDSLVRQNLIYVFDDPKAEYIAQPNSQFFPAKTFDFVNLSSGFVESYLWEFGDGKASSLEHPSSVSFDTVGIFPVSLTVWNHYRGCESNFIDTVQVLPPLPIADFSGADTGCAPLTVKFKNQSLYENRWYWDFGDGETSENQSPQHTYDSVGIYSVKLRVENISGEDSVVALGNVVVIEDPQPDISIVNDELFWPDTLVTITDASQGEISEWQWEFGTFAKADIRNPGQVVFDTMGLFLVQLIVSNEFGCQEITSDSVLIKDPLPVVGFGSPDTGCVPFEVTFENRSKYGNDYYWDFGDGNTSEDKNPRHTYDSVGVYAVKLVVTNKSGEDSLKQFDFIHVHEQLIPQFDIFPKEQFYPDSLVSLVNTTEGVVDSVFWVINRTDTSYSKSPENIGFDTVGEYKVRLWVENNHGCAGSFTDTVLILPPLPIAEFVGADTGCSPLQVMFQNNSLYGTDFYWDFGDGQFSTDESPSHVYSQVGLYHVSLRVTNVSGADSVVHFGAVQVVEPPVSNFTISPAIQIFPETDFSFLNTSVGQIETSSWNFGDGSRSPSRNPGIHTFDTSGEYIVSLVVANSLPNCSAVYHDTVIILPPIPIPQFSGPDSGCVPLTIQFKNETINGETYKWDFGDGVKSTAMNPKHVYYNAGQYTVKLTAYNSSGSDSVIQNNVVHVYETPVALFTTNPSTEIDILAPAEIFFNNFSTNADIYLWDFGDGQSSTERSTLHTFREAGEYEVVLIASSSESCTDTFELFPPLRVIEGGKIHVPNVFKPDGKIEENKIFKPVIKGNVKDYELYVFNRWGEQIFYTEDPEEGWDGFYRDQFSEQEVYVWKVMVTFYEGNRQTLIGDVTLLR